MRRGQSLIDILVGIAIGAIFIFAAAMAISQALRTGSQAAQTQAASWLAQGLLSNAQTWSGGDWHNVLALATGTAYQYFLITSSSPYVATSGIETVSVGTTTYWRYFYLTDVERNNKRGHRPERRLLRSLHQRSHRGLRLAGERNGHRIGIRYAQPGRGI